jgi:hypothetical protein
MMQASVEDLEKVKKLKERFDEFDNAKPKPDSISDKSDSSSTSSSSEATVTDNISKLMEFEKKGVENSDNQENSGHDKLTEENKRK